MLLSARLQTTTAEFSVRIRDLSSYGIKIEGNGLPVAGTDTILTRGNREYFGSLVWSNGLQAGVEFEEPLNDEEMAALTAPVPLARTVESVEKKRPGFKPKTLTAEELEIGSSWVRPTRREALRD